MSPSPSNYFRRSVRWLLPAALLAFTPKCLVCLLAYAGIGASLGIGGPEICGAASSSTVTLWTVSFVVGGTALSAVGFYVRHRATTKTYSNRQKNESETRAFRI